MDTNELVARGLARYHRGRLIPTMRGGDESADLFPVPPADFATLSDEELQTFIDATADQLLDVSSEPASFTTDDLDPAALIALARDAGEQLQAARAELARRADEAEGGDAEGDEGGEGGEAEGGEVETASTEDIDAEFAALAELANADTDPEAPAEPEVPAEVAVTASAEPEVPAAPPAVRRPPRPSQRRQVAERADAPRVALTAAAGTPGMSQGESFPSMDSIADAMIAKRRNFGLIADGTHGEKVPIVRASWDDLYPVERTLTEDPFTNMELIKNAVGPAVVQSEFRKRKEGALVASGGLCAPVTPYYQLQMISVAERPVRAALPSFNADRGGMRFARPASLSAVTTGVGVRTADEDAAGGTEAEKTCQVIPCPDFEEADVQILFHCLQFGNLGARTFPELVTQWNNLVLAAHARLAESELLTQIDAASTAVTAGDLGLGASAALPGQILTAVNGLRSRHRTDPNAIMRLLLPFWAVDLIVDDVIRGQFQRFDTDQAKVTAMFRSWGVEPSFYIDGAAGASQVYGNQVGGALLPFPSTVRWYIYPEGSFIYLDGGTLELGIVRDSVLNKTNDFQIFGETFEAVSFVGVEALAVTSTTCDSGTVSAPHATTCPISY